MTRLLLAVALLVVAGPARADLAPSRPEAATPAEPTCGSPEWDALRASLAAYCAAEPARERDEGGRRRLLRACRHVDRALRRCADDASGFTIYRFNDEVHVTLTDPAKPSFSWFIDWSGPRAHPRVESISYRYDDCDCC